MNTALITTETAQTFKLVKNSEETKHTHYVDNPAKTVTDVDSSTLAVSEQHDHALIRCVPNAPVTVSADFTRAVMALPAGAFTKNSRGRQLNLGYGVMQTAVSFRLPTPAELKATVGPESQKSAMVPYLLTAHNNAKVEAFESQLAPVVRQMQQLLTESELAATAHTGDDWQGLYGSCWDKVNVSVSDGDKVPFTSVHFDSNNRGRCAILLIGEFTGGEQLIVNGSGANEKVFKVATHAGDMFVADYHRLRHAALPVTSGRRIAIICYSSRLVEDFLCVRKHWQTEGGLLDHVCAPARKRQRVN